jgi:hypothetical protein
MREKKTTSVDGDLKQSWGSEAHATCCTMKEKSCIEYFCMGIGKLKEGVGGGGGGGERDRCLLCAGEESDSHLLLLRPKTLKWKEGLIKSKWSYINEGIEIRMIMTVKNATEQRNLGSLAHNIKYK